MNYLSNRRLAQIKQIDRAIRLMLLTGLLVLLLAYPGFLLFVPITGESVQEFLGKWLPGFLQPAWRSLLTFANPLKLKESIATFIAVYGMGLWLLRSVLAGRFTIVWTPLHLPFLILVMLAGLSLFRENAFLLRLHDFGLILSYGAFIHLFMLYGRKKRFRNQCLAVSFRTIQREGAAIDRNH